MNINHELNSTVGLNPRPLAGQTALVTGSASGIGRAIAELLARAGANIALADRDEAGLVETAKAVAQQDVRSSSHGVDLADRSATERLAQAVLAEWGTIDILVNCAGYTGKVHGVANVDMEHWDNLFAINLTAPLLLMQHIGKQMVERGSGRIINITSSSAHRAPGLPAYASSKSALMQLTRAGAAEFGSHGITVNAIAPGVTETPIMNQVFPPDQMEMFKKNVAETALTKRISKPEEVAEAALFLCLPNARQITGQTIHVSGGLVV
jgi:NAD(P)-dependent dehydrogenase (short-subunit alcohol dehydrogenase family)